MDLYILNKELKSVGILDSYLSLIWTERYSASDDFEMEILMSDFIRTGIRPDYYVYQRNSKNLMLIENMQLKKNEEDPPTIVIKGRGLEALLDRRITGDITISRENPDVILSEMMDEMFLNPTDEKRKTDRLKFVDSENEEIKGMKYGASCKYTSLYSIVMDICEALNIGFRAWLNDENLFCYQFYKGTDRSWSQDIKTWIVYSPKFNNLISTNFHYDNTTYKNHILIYGEEASETTNPTSGITLYWPQITLVAERENAVGLERKEGTLDCSDVSRWQGDYILGTFDPKDPEDVTHGWKKLPEWSYRELLRIKAEERLHAMDVTTVYEAEADANMQWELDKDFKLGDIVQVVSEFGMESACRIDSITLSHDTSGMQYYPTFVAIDNKPTEEGGARAW